MIKKYLMLPLICGGLLSHADIAKGQDGKKITIFGVTKTIGEIESPEQEARREKLTLELLPKILKIDSIVNEFNNETDIHKKELILNNFSKSDLGKSSEAKLSYPEMYKNLAIGFAAVNNESKSDAYIKKIIYTNAKYDAVGLSAQQYIKIGRKDKAYSMVKAALDHSFLPNGKLNKSHLYEYEKLVKIYCKILPAGSEKEKAHYIKAIYDFNEGYFPSDVSNMVNDPSITYKDQFFYLYAKILPKTESKQIAYLISKAFQSGSVPQNMQSEVLLQFNDIPNLSQHLKDQLAINKKNFDKQLVQLFNKTDITGKVWGASFFKGKYILIDFWGSWCGPCRASHPHLKEVYAKYKDHGLEIIGVAKEGSGTITALKEIWKKAVEEDEINWISLLSNENEAEFDAVKEFGIGVFPTKILLDKDGNQIGRFGGSPEEMDQKLKEIFGS